MQNNDSILLFETYRPVLMGIAYRFLSTVSDAEDVVQDVYLKWSNEDIDTIQNPEAWLKTVCTRNCLDIVKSVERKRIDYVGTWLPEPIQTETSAEDDYLNQAHLADSLSTAFIVMLERLTPKERAAYLLYEIFDTPYRTVAEALNLEEQTCRKLVSRAKSHIEKNKKRALVSPEKQAAFVNAFEFAITSGDSSNLQDLLANDIVLRADGGGKVAAILKPIEGSLEVLNFLVNDLKQFWHTFTWLKSKINGNDGFIIKSSDHIHAIVSFEFNEQDQASEIFIMRNPDKMAALKTMPIN
ncbi:RNA polymerase sigma factor SigJ [Agaribacterium sp. ZY112]|uniref:RNA polymerase sigma factor SigJ n=1 Tax=Agaribacterium sp. ZY112 TaxID=3233574 RepID=UPI003523CACA